MAGVGPQRKIKQNKTLNRPLHRKRYKNTYQKTIRRTVTKAWCLFRTHGFTWSSHLYCVISDEEVSVKRGEIDIKVVAQPYNFEITSSVMASPIS